MTIAAANPVYAAQALAHWKRWRPKQLAQIPDPQQFFAELSAQVAQQVDQLSTELAGPDPTGEDYLTKLGRLRMARHSAEAQILRELVLLPAEQDDPPSATTAARSASSTSPGLAGDWLPTVLRPDHPRYHELDGDPGLNRR
ncbi:MAG: hypothetical protein KY440_10375 [Actinobacteria bacterium]|nr:hypothetical protein [Actinomycetota bacterium]